MSLLSLCKKISSTERIDISECQDVIPEAYRESVHSLIDIMRYKVNNADKVNVKFLENTFEDIDNLEQQIANKTSNGDIPDVIIFELSEGLYNKIPADLTEDETVIIKTLSLYILLQ